MAVNAKKRSRLCLFMGQETREQGSGENKDVRVFCPQCRHFVLRGKSGSTVEINCNACRATLLVVVNGVVDVRVLKPGRKA